ncbi:MucB/RseB C-terminal domain-containing protein [Halomonas elongata]|uniref:MucB/RseB C-terminal domain-containing protein n=2 Tax=Halomonas elongata TaxID=2746 RepID=UPI00186BB0D3|nr:MucB/RseB C-terminal domain-containing protein [Halomonas elongata]MBW5799760.1 MucB/RseB C-terminal domain-containing protein [Halomonas elongata]WVI70331.1 MucB/RseB C-terminal domain-containing protein [Halomonas elongata]
MWRWRKQSDRMRPGWASCFLLAGCVALPALAQEDASPAPDSEPFDCASLAERDAPSSADAWFVRSRWAGHCYIFQARAVRIGVDGVRTLALSHDISKGVEREVARFLDGPPAVHERRGGAGRLSGAKGAVRLESSARHLEELYRLRLAGESRIASRRAVRLEIEPLDDQRYGRRLWLDASTALPLKQVLLDEDGRAIETFQITELQDPQLYQGKIEGESGQADQVEHSWRPGWLPAGFEPQIVAASEVSHANVEQRVYGDGLATLSLFVEPVSGQQLLKPGVHRLGVSHAAVQHRELGGRPRQVVVMGELPPSVLQRVAKSVEWRGERSAAASSLDSASPP